MHNSVLRKESFRKKKTLLLMIWNRLLGQPVQSSAKRNDEDGVPLAEQKVTHKIKWGGMVRRMGKR